MRGNAIVGAVWAVLFELAGVAVVAALIWLGWLLVGAVGGAL